MQSMQQKKTMYKTLCFVNIISADKHTTNKLCTKKNMYRYSNLFQLNYTICKYKDMECTDVESYEEKITSRLLCNSDTFDFNIIDVLDKFILKLTTVDIIIVYDVLNEFNTLINEFIRYNCEIDLSKFCIINLNNFVIDNTDMSLIELYSSKFKDTNVSNTTMLKKLFFMLYENLV